jgi:hypothetical protein
VIVKHIDRGERDHGTHHEHVAMREVDDAQNPVHHGVAEGDDGVNATKNKSIDDLLNKNVQFSFPKLFPVDRHLM